MLFALLDHVTTWLCLRAPIPGWEIREANPLAAWLFGAVRPRRGARARHAGDARRGAVRGAGPARAARRRLALLGLLIATSAFAAANNLDVIQQIGLLEGAA